MAVLQALRSNEGPVTIFSDSTYVVKCFNDKWYVKWQKNGWKNSQKQPVANKELWEPLVELYLHRDPRPQFRWVKGHSGDKMNDLVDELAVAAIGTPTLLDPTPPADPLETQPELFGP